MEVRSLKQRFGIIGNSEAFERALRVAMDVAPTDLTTLITGESGVGKEVFSKIIHNLSKRKHNKFIAVNCGAIPEGTIDSELFGHEKGAFTGAVDSRKGYFEHVNGGTIFLDEIGEMPQSTQSRLLRILESGEYIRVGSSKAMKTDVRIVAATNVNLLEAINKGKFRKDLYYRLNTVPINVPPLRERQGDIHLLFRKFASDFSEEHRMETVHLNEEAQLLLRRYRWPGNIRELKNIAEQISVLAEDRKVDANELARFLPSEEINGSLLPALAGGFNQNNGGMGGGEFTERDIMYKLLFDMRKDITDLKHFLLTLADGGQLPAEIANSEAFRSVTEGSLPINQEPGVARTETSVRTPIVLNAHTGASMVQPSTVEVEEQESLSISEMEKELIQKALKKHKGKRKIASEDLGISERTLYRKIKEYNLTE